jgi:ERCC4-type nuclease
MRNPIPAELLPQQVLVTVDNREQLPWDLAPLRTVAGTLQSGDYGLAAAPDVAAIERKSLEDLLGCITTGRDRFERELERLRGFPTQAVIVEASWDDLERGNWRSQVKPQSVVSSVLRWISDGTPFILAGNRTRAQSLAAKMLFLAAKKRWREARALVAGATSDAAETGVSE